MKILGIESSCDDTSVALVEASDSGFEILAELTASQIEIHKKYGGVVPEIAGRMHAEKILPVIEEVMKNQDKPDVIAVTSGPGLITGLLVGVEAAKTLSLLWNVPLVRVNHIEGHIHSVLIEGPKSPSPAKGRLGGVEYPLLALVVSGGHSEIILSKAEGKYEKIGGTKDDAAGEAFDKVAKLLDFDYPGGPNISKFAEQGDPTAIEFPRPMINSKDFDFSFSGLKTAALYHLRDNPKENVDNFCASFQQAVVDLLVSKTLKAIKKYQPKTVILAGGVSANKKLRETLEQEVSPYAKFLTPPIKYSMDNATMIAIASYHHAKKKEFINWKDLKADPNWKVYDKTNSESLKG